MPELKTLFEDYFCGTHPDVTALLPKEHILPIIQFVEASQPLPAFQHFTECAPILLVADENTYPLLGEAIIHSCGDAKVTTHIFAKNIKATDEHAATIEAKANAINADCIIALGSGTINDLCKYTAFKLSIPYVVYPTAASMNGYISANASMMVKGYQTTLKAKMPTAVVVDVETIKNAPEKMTQAGIADVLSHYTANADWLLSHLLLNTPYNGTPVSWTFPFINSLLKCSSNGNYRLLMETILLSGLTMVLAKGSYPASQSEHMIAHTMHMLFGNKLPSTLHGEEIAITTLISFHIWQHIINHASADIKPLPEMPSLFQDNVIQSVAAKAYEEKRKLASTIKNNEVQTAIKKAAETLPSQKELTTFYQATGIPVSAEAIGWKKEQVVQATASAPFSRERFTCLDIALMLGFDLKTLSDDALSHPMRVEE